METSSVKVFELRNSNYNLGDELIFNIAPNIALLDSQNTYLKFNIRLGGKDEARYNLLAAATASQYYKMVMNGTIGAESLIKSLTILSLDGSTNIEQITEYNRLARLIFGYSDNESQKNIKQLYEGRGDVILSNGGNCQLQDITGIDPQITNTLYNKKLEVCLPLRLSGILSGSDVFPNFIIGGIQIKIQLENEPWKVLMGQTAVDGQGLTEYPAVKAVQNLQAGYEQAFTFSLNGAAQVGLQSNFDLRTAQSAGNCVPAPAGGATLCQSTPFTTGQTIVIPTTGTPAGVSGVIDQITDSGGGNIRIHTLAAIDMGNPQILVNQPIWIQAHANKPQMTLSEVELICGVAQPSQKQLDSYEKAVNSSGGYALEFETWQNYPVNNSAGATKVSNLINCKLHKCKTILSTFENVQDTLSLNTDNLTCQVGADFDPLRYYYTINNLKTPSRDVDLNNYIRNYNQAGVVNQVHLKELEDGMNQAGYQIQDLTNADSNFCIARALSRYGHYFDFSEAVGETRINVDFTAQTKALLNHNFIKHIRELVITPTDKTIVM